MNVGIMGGTFDPVHIGHLIAAESARVGKGLDEVWFMPANVPPHKENAPRASAQQRLEMVCRAIEGNPYFRPLDMEIMKGGISYSVDTLRLLGQEHPHVQFHYIIGADMVQFLPQWYRIEEIVQRVRFVGLQRPGYEVDLSLLPAAIRRMVTLVPMPLIDISSTNIREARTSGRSIRYFVPESVEEYIEVNHLYEP